MTTFIGAHDIAFDVALNTYAVKPRDRKDRLIHVELYPVKKGCWSDAAWIVVATFDNPDNVPGAALRDEAIQ